MEGFVDTIMEHLTNINWEGPAAFVVAVLAVFAFLRKFSLILIIILTIVVGWGAEDIILFNLETDDALITAPLLVYTVGGVTVFLFALYSFFKSDWNDKKTPENQALFILFFWRPFWRRFGFGIRFGTAWYSKNWCYKSCYTYQKII